MKRAGWIVAALPALGGILGAAPAYSQAPEYAPRQVTVVVGFPPGGGTDIFARVFAQKLGAALGASVIVENRPGASGTIGTGVVVRAAPNGQTLLFTPSNIAMTPAIQKGLAFDVRRDLAPITLVSRLPFVLVVHPALPVRNVKELIALAKARPGALDYASSGAGGPPFFAMELLKAAAGVDINHVPYKGAGPITTAMLTGETQMSFLIPPVSKTHIDAGKMRGLGVSTRERSSVLPALPTLHEAGLHGFDVPQWQAFFAPARTPPEVVSRLHAEIVKALASPEIRQRMLAEGAEPVGAPPAELASYLAQELARYGTVAQRLKLGAE